MRALGFNGPWKMAVVDRPEPEPTGSEAVIDVLATGICGSDVHGYSGATNRRVSGQVMGHEAVGRTRIGLPGVPAGSLVTFNPIIACGRCAACEAGETQVCSDLAVIGVEPTLDGSFAERLAVPDRNIVPLAESLPPLHGALVEPLAVGYHALMRGAPEPDDLLLIIGGGPVGQATAIAARRIGLERVLVSEPVPARRDLLKRLGFDTTTPAELSGGCERVLGGRASLVVDAVGIGPSFADALSYSKTLARIVLVGMGSTEMRIEPYGISTAERIVLGSYCYSETHFRETADWVSAGHPELELLIDRTVTLDEAPEAFRTIAESPDGNKTLVLSDAAD